MSRQTHWKCIFICLVACILMGEAIPAGGPTTKTIQVLVARQDLRVGETLCNVQALFGKATFRAGEEPAGALTSFDKLDGRIIRQALPKGFPITKKHLRRADGEVIGNPYTFSLRFATDTLPPAKDLIPGKRVDIVLMAKEGARVIVKNALILSVETPNIGSKEIITFAIVPEDVLKLALAKETAPLKLVIPEQATVLRARRDLAICEILSDPGKLFTTGTMRKELAPRNAIRVLEELKGRKMRKLLRANEVVTHEYLFNRDDKSDEGLDVPAGHVALPIRVNTDKLARPMLQNLVQGRVNVILSTRRVDDGTVGSAVIAENVLVLHLDDPQENRDERIITLAVTPQVATCLAACRDLGTFSIVHLPAK